MERGTPGAEVARDYVLGGLCTAEPSEEWCKYGAGKARQGTGKVTGNSGPTSRSYLLPAERKHLDGMGRLG